MSMLNVFFYRTAITTWAHFSYDAVSTRTATAFRFCRSMFGVRAVRLSFSLLCLVTRASKHTVKSIEIKQTIEQNGKSRYGLSKETFDSIPDLISYYKTYAFVETDRRSTTSAVYRLDKPLALATYNDELEQQAWYQPNLTREQAQQLLSGVRTNIEVEEATFLVHFSSRHAHNVVPS
jgi:hypothetical protein